MRDLRMPRLVTTVLAILCAIIIASPALAVDLVCKGSEPDQEMRLIGATIKRCCFGSGPGGWEEGTISVTKLPDNRWRISSQIAEFVIVRKKCSWAGGKNWPYTVEGLPGRVCYQ
jgi:hypothetical protein